MKKGAVGKIQPIKKSNNNFILAIIIIILLLLVVFVLVYLGYNYLAQPIEPNETEQNESYINDTIPINDSGINDTSRPPVCGDGKCTGKESYTNCPADCKKPGGGGGGGGNPPCSPNCAGKSCGSNGCQGSCGSCNTGYECNSTFSCSLIPCTNETGCNVRGTYCQGNMHYNCTNTNNDICLERINMTSCSLGYLCNNATGCYESINCTSDDNCTSFNNVTCNGEDLINNTGICSNKNCKINSSLIINCNSLDSYTCDEARTKRYRNDYSCSLDECVNLSSLIEECNNTKFCDGEEKCELGSCTAGTAPNCADSFPCTVDSCNEIEKCNHVANNSACLPTQFCDISQGCVDNPTCPGTDDSCGIFPSCTNCSINDNCYGTERRDYFCSAANSCAYRTITKAENITNGNCGNGKDDDCDGITDTDPECYCSNDLGCTSAGTFCDSATGVPYTCSLRGDGCFDRINLPSCSVGWQCINGSGCEEIPQCEPCLYPANGNWNILLSTSTSCCNQIITLNGNLTIYGQLTFRNVTLKMNSTYNGQYWIKVMNEGIFNISDFNGDPSIFKAANTSNKYLFYVYPGSKFKMRNSELYDAGFSFDKPGLVIQTNNSIIENSIFINNNNGIRISSSNNNTIKHSLIRFLGSDGIRLENADNNQITNVTILGPGGGGHGIFLDSSDNNSIADCDIGNTTENIILESSRYNKITNCNLWNVALASFFIRNSNFNNIERCNISYYAERGGFNGIGINFMEHSWNNIFSKCIISNQVGGIVFMDNSTNIIKDSKILQSLNKDILVITNPIFVLMENSTNILLNTSFDKNKIEFGRINNNISYEIIVKWYLDVHGSDSYGNPLNNARVRAWNMNDELVFDTYTNPNGWISQQELIEYTLNSTSTKYFTNYTINVSHAGYIEKSQELNLSNSKVLYVNLDEQTIVSSFSPWIRIKTEIEQLLKILFNI